MIDAGEHMLLLAPYWALIRGIALSSGVRPIDVPFSQVLLRDPAADPEALIDHAAKPEVVYDHKASMLQDVEARRQTEIDYLNGGIVRFGRELGVPTALNEAITALVKGVERSWA